jgi:hypothetical protein
MQVLFSAFHRRQNALKQREDVRAQELSKTDNTDGAEKLKSWKEDIPPLPQPNR